MPSRSFYYQTSHGFLERNEQGAYQTLPTFTSAEYPSAEFDYEFSTAGCDASRDSSGLMEEMLGSPIEDESSVDGCDANGQQWQGSFANQLTSNQIFLDDAVMDLDGNCQSRAIAQDFEPSSPEMEWRDGYQEGLPHSLSRVEEKRLHDIAMPPCDVITKVVEEIAVAPARPGPKKRVRSKKRKPVQEIEAADAVKRRCDHNAIEKRYRTNLNDKIMTLRQGIPSLRIPPAGEQTDTTVEDCDESGLDTVHNFGKAVILTKAVEYIAYLESHIQRLSSDVLSEKARVMAFERLAVSEPMGTSKVACHRNPTTETLQTIQARFCETNPSKDEAPPTEPETVRRSKRKAVKTESVGRDEET